MDGSWRCLFERYFSQQLAGGAERIHGTPQISRSSDGMRVRDLTISKQDQQPLTRRLATQFHYLSAGNSKLQFWMKISSLGCDAVESGRRLSTVLKERPA